ncbi:helicase-related protein [Microbispora sp. H10885]|uniref:DEAD/DEAH box helicase n=1 Tax=Microbispora sp. H10885 TaxID=2729110 RepID=UPI001600FFDA|nr:helicase-related protein [Microbispora sp. H10885]
MSDDDLRYRPSILELNWLKELQPKSCLVVGEVPDGSRDAIKALALDVRSTPPVPMTKRLHRGAYAIKSDLGWQAMVVLSGQDPAAPETARSRFIEDGHLLTAWAVQSTMWASALPLTGDSRFRVGAMVRPEGGAVGRVAGLKATPSGYVYEVDIRGEIKILSEEALTEVEGDPSRPEFWLTQPPADAAGLSLTLTWTKLNHPLTDTLYSYASSKTVFRAYQFKPVLKVLTGSSGRILIADEVGLGKTIEAGLIWSELEQRGKLDRVLVVAPSVLKFKWQAEMRRRFDRDLALLKPRDLEDFADRWERGEHPNLRGVISLESLRGADKVLAQLATLQPRFDLVIVDEAHYMRNRESKSHALGQLLADWTDYLILLSATPLNLGNDDLFNLMSLLDPEHFSDRETFERQLRPNEVLNEVTRSLIGNTEPRKLLVTLDQLKGMRFGRDITDRPDYALLLELLKVERPLTHEEKARARRLLADLNVLSGVLTRTRKADVPDRKAVREPRNIHVEWTKEEQDYYRAVYLWAWRRAWSMGVPPGFVMQMPLRQAASCIPASQESLRLRDPKLFRMEIDDVDDDVDEVDLSGLLDVSAQFKPVQVDTKYDRLLEELEQLRALGIRQMMIFSFFRGTLSYLARRLREHFTVRVMDGGVPPEEREEIMRDFREGGFQILLLSEVGSEGLDFEFCNVLVNYDLPWNPMRVEQRIGRLDRFGQEHDKIFIYNMHVPGTIETDIFQRLYDRIGIFQNSIGELEPILRDNFSKLLNPALSPDQVEEQIERVAVAAQQRDQATEELRASRALLSGLDGLLVEGFSEHGPGNGRFVGSTEIRRMIDELFRRYSARRTEPDQKGIFYIVGSHELATKLRWSRADETGSKYPLAQLAARLQDRTRLECTFEPETASKYDIELLSARHPLVKLTLAVLQEEDLALPRFGSVTVPGLPQGGRYLMTVDLAESGGLRPQLELWITAVDLDTYEVQPDAGEALLTALAEGTLGDGDSIVPKDGLLHVWHSAQNHVAARLLDTERTRRQENQALVEGRIRAHESTIDLQIQKTQELLARISEAGIRRLHEGRLRNLRANRQAIRDRLSARKALSISLTPVAVALVTAQAAPSPSIDTTGRRPSEPRLARD